MSLPTGVPMGDGAGLNLPKCALGFGPDSKTRRPGDSKVPEGGPESKGPRPNEATAKQRATVR
eukprot:CAMPEP_0172629146 /NCGR_PEP_ID=MMETSP1068-20121228/165958_1 /TAXON_ID=35684 /ORGANISM="Pseudopedinella elastica, Strain CCMP716" /LENGTH=62 /DNA_ID=CAMNT_0013439589 /DNA_START=654 /DNA_END=842 /DNA_ORIENTATION=-